MSPSATLIARSYLGVGLLLLGVTACSDSSDAASTGSTTAAAETTAETEASSSTVTSTTELVTTTTEPRTIVAVGTWTRLDLGSVAVKLPSGYTGLDEALSFDGDLVGTTLYDIGVSPVGDTGLVTSYADGTFKGSIAGVGEGTLAWSEPETDVTLPAAPGSAPLVGASGDFFGATGTFSWAYTDDSHGTYEVRLVWD